MIGPYIEPETGNTPGQAPPGGPTDFFSLTTAPPEPSALPEVGGRQRTDFASLQAGVPLRPQVILNNTLADHTVNFLTPCLIFILANVVLLFLLNVRFIYTAVFDTNLRFFAVSFVLGIVALNRLIARQGSEESYLYIFGLFLAVGLYTLTTTGGYDVGSVARQYLNENIWLALLFNMSVIIGIWWMVNRLTHECCVDESSVAGDIGIFTATAARMRTTLRRMAEPAGPSRAERMAAAGVNDAWHNISAFDPTAPLPKAAPQQGAGGLDYTSRLPARHPGMALFYFSIPVMLIFTLGLRVIQHMGMPAVRMGGYYMALYTFCVLFLLCLTSLRQLRAYFNVRGVTMPAALSWLWMGTGLVMVMLILWLAASLPLPALPPAVYVDEQQVDVYTLQTARIQLLDVTPPTMSFLEQYRVRERMELAGLVVIGIAVLYGALKGLGYLVSLGAANKSELSGPMFWLISALTWLLFKCWPALFRWAFSRGRIRIQRSIALSSRYDNPLGRAEGAKLSTRGHIAYAYDALRALATDIGAPPKASQTPYEFLANFPEGLESIREEAEEIIRLHVIASYSTEEMNARLEDRLRKFWYAFRAVRNRYVR